MTIRLKDMTPEQRAKRQAITRRWYQANRERELERYRRRAKDPIDKARRAGRHLKKKYGLSLLDKDILSVIQGDACANPGCRGEFISLDKAHVDHDHGTGKVRALLCHNCNVALGLLSENTKRIRGLADYLETWERAHND